MEIRPSCSQTQLTALTTDAQTLSVVPEEGAGRAAPTPGVHPENKRAKQDSYFCLFFFKNEIVSALLSLRENRH